jgi:hypothetical protein
MFNNLTGEYYNGNFKNKHANSDNFPFNWHARNG